MQHAGQQLVAAVARHAAGRARAADQRAQRALDRGGIGIRVAEAEDAEDMSTEDEEDESLEDKEDENLEEEDVEEVSSEIDDTEEEETAEEGDDETDAE